MTRPFPRPAREALRVFFGLLVLGAACSPNQGVKPGAPELTEFIIVQSGPTATVVTPDTPQCATGQATGDACHPKGVMADVADGGTIDADLPPDTLCRQVEDMNWCTCVADGQDPSVGKWNCDKFTNVVAVIAVFDRLLDTTPLDPGDASAVEDVMQTSVSSGAPSFTLLTDYSATGAANGLIFNLFGPAFFGNFRGDGPSLFSMPQPGFPSGATITVTLNGDKVRAKDGHTLFSGSGQLLGGTLVFTTAPFSAALSEPDAMAMDPNAVTLAFTNSADPMGHVTATSNGAPIAIDVTDTGDGATFTITPMGGGAWPAGATIVITVDGTTQNALGQTIDMPATLTFTAP